MALLVARSPALTRAQANDVKTIPGFGQEDLLSPGHHFFYLSARDLAAGRFFYTIEFPKGVVIVSRTMLVVK